MNLHVVNRRLLPGSQPQRAGHALLTIAMHPISDSEHTHTESICTCKPSHRSESGVLAQLLFAHQEGGADLR